MKTDLTENFKQFIQENNLCSSKDRILLAISGGIDSMVLVNLFRNASYTFGIAHCNFGLRGKESDADEKFVCDYAKKHNIPFHIMRFSQKDFEKEEGVSTQMAARDLRYKWFEEIRKKYNYKHIALAHHSDDVVETLLINITRGTGLAGLHGIPVKRGKIIRPLLFTDRVTIEQFAKENSISFREDSSNASDKYTRNKIRHHVIPVLKQINPSLNSSIANTIKYIQEVETVLKKHTEIVLSSIIKKNKTGCEIFLKEFPKLEPANFYLFEILKEYGFNSEVVQEISTKLSHLKTGTVFFSATHRLLINRDKLIISKIQKNSIKKSISISETTTGIKFPLKMNFGQEKNVAMLNIPKTKQIACLDKEKLQFPLILRKWKTGDKFKPLGMTGFKKLSDFFTDNKISLIDKENQWLLTSGNEIVWIVGHRIDDRFKITPKTGKVFVCELSE